MSFILDALKKSEAERNRKTGPVLMDMRIAHPRRRLPMWVWIIAIVLLANLALLAYVLLRGSSPAQVAATTGTESAAADAPATAPSPPPIVVAPPAGNTSALPAPALPAAPAATGGVVMQSNEVVSPGSTTPSGTGTANPGAAADPADNSLPTDEDLRSGGVGIPELRLSLHVYDASPANRFVLLNSSRLVEGQETADGVRVERITPTGVVLSHRGRRFQMRPGN